MATLSVTHTESLTLNGRDLGTTTSFDIGSITNVYSRIYSVPENQDTSLLVFDDLSGIEETGESQIAGALEVDTVKYIRISNLDSTNAVNLRFTLRDSGSDEQAAHDLCDIQLPAGQSYFLGGALTTIGVNDGTGDTSTAFTFSMIREIFADSGANTIDVELFVANS
tara:strand:+ start:197 stop:697 length:501 start_codon:yes stop_codon:yes gene_type:complete